MEKKTPIKSFMTRLSGLTAAAIVAGSLLFTHSASLADTQDDAAFTCASAVNVMDCIKQTGAGTTVQQSSLTAIPINSQALGFTGPVSVGLRYDNYLSWIMDVGYAQQYKNTAAAFKLSAGLNERRANVTLGYAITPKQQIKLTYEYLAQNLPFDFASGTVNEWVNQNAFGAAYQYMLDHGIVRALEVYGNYTKANSKELSDVEMYTDNILTQVDQRRIAGGTQQTAGVNVTLTPLKSTILKLGAGYSSLTFDTKAGYTPTGGNYSDNAVLAYNADISQLLTPTLMVGGGIGTTAAGSTYTAKVSKILPWSLEASLMGQYTAATEGIPGATTVTAGLSYPAPKTYTNTFSAGLTNLKNWVQQPVVYNTRVFARAEEKLIQVKITAPENLPAQAIPVGVNLTPVYTKDYFAFDPAAYDKIDYQASVIQTGNPSITYPLSALNLKLQPIDSYNQELVSSAVMPASAMTPGNYTLTIGATGYRSGQAIPPTTNTNLQLTVASNQNLAAPSWLPGASLNMATAGQPYPGTDLSTVVKDNSKLPPPGDTYSFTIVNQKDVTWLQIGPDNKTLTAAVVNGTPVNVPPEAANPTLVQLSGKSTASGNDIIDSTTGKPATQNFNLVVSKGGVTPPTWVSATDQLPDAPYGTPYLINGKDNISLASNIKSNGVDPNATNLTYKCTDTAKCSDLDATYQQLGATATPTGLTLNKTNGVVSGTPNDINQKNISFPVVATNTQTLKDSDPATFTINFVQNNNLSGPTWKTGSDGKKIAFPFAATPSTSTSPKYTQPLTNYIQGSITNDQLTFSNVNTGSCKWLSFDNKDTLSGTPNDTDKGVCTIVEIDAASAATGGQPTQFKDPSVYPLSITVVGAIAATSTNTITQAPIYANYASIDLTKADTYFSDGDPNDTFTITPITVPTGMQIDSNGKLGGTPNDVDQIGTALKFTVSSTLHNDPANPPYVAPFTYTLDNFVTTNPSLSVTANWKSGITLPPAINGVPYTPNIPVYPNYMDISTKSNGNTVADKISLYSIQRTDINKCPWLTIDSKSGIFSSTQNPATNQNCEFSLTVTSQATGQPVTLSGTQTITVANGPVWNISTLPNTAMYYNNDSFPTNGIVVSEANGWVTPQVPPLTGIAQVNTDTSNTPWLTVNGFTSPDINVVITAKNLNDDTLVNYIQAGCDQTNPATSKYSITLAATDTSSGSTPSLRSFTTCLLPNNTLKTSPQFNSNNLPLIVNGQTYTANLDPYQGGTSSSTPAALDKTKSGDTDVGDKLVFSNMAIDTSQTIPYCGDKHYTLSSTGSFNTGSQNTDGVSCGFKMSVYSTATDTTRTYSVTVPSTPYVLPNWQTNPPLTALPYAVAGAKYDAQNGANNTAISISPNLSATYLTKTKYNGADQTDTYSFSADSRNQSQSDGCKWLQVIDAGNGTLGGDVPANASNCQAYLSVSSSLAGGAPTQLDSRPIEIKNVVTWNPNTTITVWYPCTDTNNSPDQTGISCDGNTKLAYPNKNLITSDATNVTFSNPNGNPTTMIPGFTSDNKNMQMILTPDNINNGATTAQGTFTLDAQPNDNGVLSHSPTFNVFVKGTLINPVIRTKDSANNNILMPTSTIGNYSENINPYNPNGTTDSCIIAGTSNKTACMTKTLVASTSEPLTSDTITFSSAEPIDSTIPLCSQLWTGFQISASGVISGTVTGKSGDSTTPTCQVPFKVSSLKNNNYTSSVVSLIVPGTGSVPAWVSIPNTLSIPFDDPNSTNINLTSLINATGTNSPASDFYFTNTNGQKTNGSWQIISTSGTFYLVRNKVYTYAAYPQGAYDAGTVGTSETLNITATNNAGSTPSGNFGVNVNPDKNVAFYFKASPSPSYTVISVNNKSYPLSGNDVAYSTVIWGQNDARNMLITVAGDSASTALENATPIANDVITMNNWAQNDVNGSRINNRNIGYIMTTTQSPQNNYYIAWIGAVDSNIGTYSYLNPQTGDYGLYIQGIKSKARGDTNGTQISPYAMTVNVVSAPVWNSNSKTPSIQFDSGNADSNAINLTSYIDRSNNRPAADSFAIIDKDGNDQGQSFGNWQIISGSTTYLVRQPNDGKDSTTQCPAGSYDASKVGSLGPDYIIIRAKNSYGTSDAKFTVTLNPDRTNIRYTANKTYTATVGSTQSSIMIVNNNNRLSNPNQNVINTIVKDKPNSGDNTPVYGDIYDMNNTAYNSGSQTYIAKDKSGNWLALITRSLKNDDVSTVSFSIEWNNPISINASGTYTSTSSAQYPICFQSLRSNANGYQGNDATNCYLGSNFIITVP